MNKDKMAFMAEYTDTFSGEANYSWAKRRYFELPEECSDLALVRKAKAELELTGVRCKRESYGDMIVLRPCGTSTVVFITPNY